MSATDKINSLADSINKRDMDAFAGHWAADVVVYSPHLPEPLRGRDAVTENMATFPNRIRRPKSHFERDHRRW